MIDRFYAVLLIISSFAAQILKAEDIVDTNFRERCRKTVSGQYSNVLADKTLAEDAVTLATEAIKKSQKQIDADEVKMKALHRKLESSEYSTEAIQERDMLTAQIKLYREQKATSETQLAAAQKLLLASKKRIESIHKKVESIFTVTMVPDPEGGPRPLVGKIEWKSPCPKYRVLCPLPARDAGVLRELRNEIDDSDLSCERYVKIK